jgi:hypothetical protein
MTGNETPPSYPLGTEALASIESPLAGVNPRSLDALMAEDPAKLQDADFDQVISAMRALRAGWQANEQKKDLEGPKPKAAPRAKAAPRSTTGKVSINLDELFKEGS